MTKLTGVGLFAFSLALGVMAVPDAAQTADPSQTQPTFRTEANYVRVDAYVTKNGAPVTDLTAADFEIFENNVPQRIEQFEHVSIRGNIPQELRAEPGSVRESRAALDNPRSRVFVIFLDVGHVEFEASHQIRQPLIDMLNSVVGQDDLVAVMTPDMSAADLTFARKTTTIEGFLTRHWDWGERYTLIPRDPVERSYEACYGSAGSSPIAAEMIARRREKQTLDALEDLVVYLRDAREERKAIIAITDGWRLYGPNGSLENAGRADPPPVGVVPGTGTLGIGDRTRPNGIPVNDCTRDRLILAQIDDPLQFRRLLDEANRANASFYPVDPRGLPVFDAPIGGPGSVPSRPPSVDQAILKARVEALRTLAGATDGLAIVSSNDLAGGLRRVVADLSSYYLLGYYSNGKVDGRFHSLAVRVKRAGVQVRARRGYLAATPEAAARLEMKRRVAEPKALPTGASAETLAMEAVLRPLGSLSRETSIRLWPVAGWKPDGSAEVLLVGELGPGDVWKAGAQSEITLTKDGRATVGRVHVVVPAGARTYKASLILSDRLSPGDYTIHVHTVGTSLMSSSDDTVAVQLPRSPDGSGAVVIRRGPFTGNKEVPTADMRFRRNESIRIELPAVETSETLAARLLDRAGKPLAVPVTAAVRDDSDGTRWHTAQLPLYPLAPGDYVIEVSNGTKRMLTPFRIIP